MHGTPRREPTVDATMPVPTYSGWLHDTDQRPMYRYFRRLVQLLLWQRDEKIGLVIRIQKTWNAPAAVAYC